MTSALKSPNRLGLLVTGLAPLIPQILGSAFNIWYNTAIVMPLLMTTALKQRFVDTVNCYNLFVYPLAVGAWLWVVYSLRDHFQALLAGNSVDPVSLEWSRRRVIHLPWFVGFFSGAAWLLCIPIFSISLLSVGDPLATPVLWHLPISFLVSAFISVTQSFFLVELATHWGLFGVFFRGERPDQMPNTYPLSLRGRGLMWAVSAGICPTGSLMLLNFAPSSPAGHPIWFATFVGSIGIAFGLCSAILISRLVAEPVDQLRSAAKAVGQGNLDAQVPLIRADEFGSLIGEFNGMVKELREKERLRRTFGLHVGAKTAELILARDPGLGGSEEIITVMFVDIRSFTQRSANSSPQKVVALLNEFLCAMVQVVEVQHSGMVNKFLGDGFMALFGVGSADDDGADEALRTALSMQGKLRKLNRRLAERGEEQTMIGIGIHTGPAIVGSIGSPQRMEFTAIGSTVNLASRIESLTKTVGTTLLLTDATRAALRGEFKLNAHPPQAVKGVAKPVRVWGVRT